MKIITSQSTESILCTLPSGEQIEVTMVCAEGEECFAEPNIEGAVAILKIYLDRDSI